jgi:hypothetical protein
LYRMIDNVLPRIKFMIINAGAALPGVN